jgi:hypothetical protein
VFSHVKTDAHSDVLVVHPWQFELFHAEGRYHPLLAKVCQGGGQRGCFGTCMR